MHEDEQVMAEYSDDSDNLFTDGLHKQKLLDNTKSAAACTVNVIKVPIMRNSPHLIGLVLRTRSRTKCVYVMSNVLDAGLSTYMPEAKAVERGLRITEVIDGYAVVQVRGICEAPNSTDALIATQVDRKERLGSMSGYTRQSGITMP